MESMLYDFIVTNNIATEDEISLVTNINGWNVKSLNDIIWCRAGYHDAKQCLECEPENFWASNELRWKLGIEEQPEEDEDED